MNDLTEMNPLFDILEEVASLSTALAEARKAKLENLSSYLERLRGKAFAARQASGIENLWDYVDKTFQSQDAEVKSSREPVANWWKGTDLSGPVMKPKSSSAGRSTAYINITKAPVRFAAWAAKEMAVPDDSQFWELRVPEDSPAKRLAAQSDNNPAIVAAAASLLANEQNALTAATIRLKDILGDVEQTSGGEENTLEDLATAAFDLVYEKGTAVIYGPGPMNSLGGKQTIGYRVLDPSLIAPDPACGTNISLGSHIFEGPELFSARQLRSFRDEGDESGWVPEMLDEVLQASREGGDDTPFKFYYFQGEVPLEDVKDPSVSLVEIPQKSGEARTHVWVNATLCAGRVVRLGSALIQGELPYHILKDQKFKTFDGERWVEYWAGWPMPVDLAPVQRSMNINWRSNDDNTQLSAVPQRVRVKGIVKPENGRTEWTPGKDWVVEATSKTGDELLKDVKSAFMTIDIPCRLDQIRANFPLVLSMIAPITGLDDVVRGLSPGAQVGTTQIQLNTAAAFSKRMLKGWTRCFRSMIHAGLRWLREMEGMDMPLGVKIFPPPPAIVRDVQSAFLSNVLGLAASNPTLGADPRILFEDLMRANAFDPRRYRPTPERQEELSALMSPPPDEKAQAAIEAAKIRGQALVTAQQVDSEAKNQQTSLTAENAARDRQHDRAMLELEYKLKVLEYSIKTGLDLQAAMAQLNRMGQVVPGETE